MCVCVYSFSKTTPENTTSVKENHFFPVKFYHWPRFDDYESAQAQICWNQSCKKEKKRKSDFNQRLILLFGPLNISSQQSHENFDIFGWKKNLFFERFDIFSMNFEGQIKKYVVIETSLQQKWWSLFYLIVPKGN